MPENTDTHKQPDTSEGAKHDDGKIRFDLLPGDALCGTAKVLTVGAIKYNERNWESGIKYSRVFGALQKHLWAWFQGEDNDPETGLNHIHHAGCNITFLQAYVERDMKEFDDRPVQHITNESTEIYGEPFIRTFIRTFQGRNIVKPLFVPLMKKYFLKFKAGEQSCEIRPNNYRGWNVKNVYPGRRMTLFSGYDKHDRITMDIRNTMITPDLNMYNLPQWHIDAVEEIYGKQKSWLIAYV